jgi:hypothetical protein
MDVKKVILNNNILSVEFEDEEKITIKISELEDKHRNLIEGVTCYCSVLKMIENNTYKIDSVERLLLQLQKDTIEKIIEM